MVLFELILIPIKVRANGLGVFFPSPITILVAKELTVTTGIAGWVWDIFLARFVSTEINALIFDKKFAVLRLHCGGKGVVHDAALNADGAVWG